MSWQDAFSIGASIVVGMGGGGVIVLRLADYLGKRWADRALETERHHYNELSLRLQNQLADASRHLQVELDAVSLTHQLRTKREFRRLGEMWKQFALLASAFNTVAGTGLRLVPPDEESQRKYGEEQRRNFEQCLSSAQRFFLLEELFIPEQIAEAVQRVLAPALREPYLYSVFLNHYDVGIRQRYWESVGPDLNEFNENLQQLKILMRRHINAERSTQLGQVGSDTSAHKW